MASKQRRRGWCKCGAPLPKRGGSKLCRKCQRKLAKGKKRPEKKPVVVKGGKKYRVENVEVKEVPFDEIKKVVK